MHPWKASMQNMSYLARQVNRRGEEPCFLCDSISYYATVYLFFSMPCTRSSMNHRVLLSHSNAQVACTNHTASQLCCFPYAFTMLYSKASQALPSMQCQIRKVESNSIFSCHAVSFILCANSNAFNAPSQTFRHPAQTSFRSQQLVGWVVALRQPRYSSWASSASRRLLNLDLASPSCSRLLQLQLRR